MLRKPRLTLSKMDEICRAAESMAVQIQVITDESSVEANVVKDPQIQKKHPNKGTTVGNLQECWNCGRKHEYYKRDL